MNTIDYLSTLIEDEVEERIFSDSDEKNIIALALGHPEFFTAAAPYLTPEAFTNPGYRMVFAIIMNYYEKYSTIPTRKTLIEELTERQRYNYDEYFDTIFDAIKYKLDPRDTPIIRDNLLNWAKARAYARLFDPDVRDAHQRGDYEYIEKIVAAAGRISDVTETGFWMFENIEALFKPDAIKHRTTGFQRLDRLLNNGGPSPKEVVCWLAATNVGKCHSSQTLIIEKRLSRIYELEMEDGSVVKFRGSREVQTLRGAVKVCDLTVSDELTEVPAGDDSWDLELQDV